MASFDALFKEIRPMAPEVSVLTLRRAIRTAAKRFCKETKAWQLEVAAFTLTPGSRVQDFSAVLPTDAGIHEILDMTTAEGAPILRTSPQELTALDPVWRTKTAATPTRCYRASASEVAFVYEPAAAIAVNALFTLVPLQDAETIDDSFLEDYWDGLAAGALSIALNMPKMSWYDGSLVMKYTTEFEMAIEQARAFALHDKSPKSTGMSYGGL